MVEEQTQTQAPQLDPVARAEEAVARLEAKLLETKELLAKNQEIATRNILGGQSYAGQPAEQKIETPQEYTARILRGGK